MVFDKASFLNIFDLGLFFSFCRYENNTLMMPDKTKFPKNQSYVQ